MKEKIKGMLRSWVIWFNGLMAALVAGLPMLQDALPQLVPFADDALYKRIGLFVVVINMLLRFKTHKSLAEK